MATNGDGLYTRDPNSRYGYIFPDKLDFEKEPFATVIPNRSVSVFKVHKTEGLANSALSHHREGAKYKQENGVWIKVFEVRHTVTHCDECGIELTESDRGKDYYGNPRGRLVDPLHKGASIFANVLCRPCFEPRQERATEIETVRNQRREARWAKEREERRLEEARRAAQFASHNSSLTRKF